MSHYIITNLTVADAPALARNNATSFWEDPNWRYGWIAAGYTVDRLVTAFTHRTPRNLLRDRDTLRHFKAVDPETGDLVGYIRWKLPEGRCKNGDGSPVWPEGQTPDVGVEERAEIEELAQGADWHPYDYEGEDDLDAILTKTKKGILEKKEYIVLEYFAVHPENQNKRVGTELLRHGVENIERLGIDIFVLAFAGGFRVYSNAGFKVLDSIVQDATRLGGNDNYAVQFMEYQVRKEEMK